MASLLVVGIAGAPGLAPTARAADDFGSGPPKIGYDISWPQCGGPYPTDHEFGIVGVNAGIVFSPNPCLADELVWAGGAAAQFYANTGNPGPALSNHWPSGQFYPEFCDQGNPDTVECAFDYGYNAALDSFANAVAAYGARGIEGSPAGNRWWLDVETSNSWRSDVSLNVAALHGAVESLRFAGVRSIGFYSTQHQWNIITGGTFSFSDYPSWVAGARDAESAVTMCAGTGFTGGGVALVQFMAGGFDANVRCGRDRPEVTSIVVSPEDTSVQVDTTQQFSATAYDQAGRPIEPQPIATWSVSGGGAITASGHFTAGSTPGGPFTVTATVEGVRGSATIATTPAPTFGLSISPASIVLEPGQTATYDVTVAPSDGFTGSVSLGVTGLPPGTAVTFSQNPAETASTITVRISESAPVGRYVFGITGTSGTVARVAGATLVVEQ